MKTIVTFICIAVIQLLPVQAQVAPEAAEDYFTHERYPEALSIYLKSFKTDTANIGLNYHIGICYLHSRSQKLKAISYLERAILVAERSPSLINELPSQAYKSLADAFHQSYEFDKAIINYEKYKDRIASDDSAQKETEETNWKIDMCRVGKALKGLSNEPISLKKGKQKTILNTISPGDYSSFLSSDQSQMTFTFKRDNKEDEEGIDGRYYEKNKFLFLVSDSIKRIADTTKFETKNMNETTVATSYDGQIVLNYRDDHGTANLYATCLNGNTWTFPEKIQRPINTFGWEENECISADGNVMYFTSDRPGGFGGKDIYVCSKSSDKEWGKAENLGPTINTPFDDQAPFIHPDGVTLYYSSNGKQKIGRFSIYTSTLNAGGWSVPMSVGFPIDTTHDQIEEIVQTIPDVEKVEKKKRKREKLIDIKDKKNQLRDNYLISFSNPNGSPLTLLKSEFVSENNNPGSVKIVIRNNSSGQTNNIFLTDMNAKKFAIILPPQGNNNITYNKEGYMIFSENIDMDSKVELFEKKEPVGLYAMEVGSRVQLNNVFYEAEKPVLKSTSDVSLKDIESFLKDNPALKVEINNLIIAKENIKQNERLAIERSEAIIQYLVSKGIEKERLIAKGDAIKVKKSPDKKPGQRLELVIVEKNHSKETLTTQ
ncbi:MAG: tpn50 [Bacteroidetes bacterium]|jgi:tetratricopeptide (TPR) repeat protein|nr:tpn50 [Bacteroidota bacterium]